jgi:hypothetical protein
MIIISVHSARAGTANTTSLPLRLNGGPDGVEAFLIELALDPAPAEPPDCLPAPGFPGRLSCTCDDPVGLVRLAGTLPPNATGTLDLATLEWAGSHPLFDAILARVEAVSPLRHAALLSTAARFGTAAPPLPDVPAAPLVDLAAAWRLRALPDQALAACMVLTRRLRVVESSMLFATDTELTLMLRMTDREGAPDSNRTRLSLYLSPCPAGGPWDQIAQAWQAARAGDGLYLPAPLYDDGWYGLQYRGPLPDQALALSLYHATLAPDGSDGPDRERAYGWLPPDAWPRTDFAAAPDRAPYSTLALGQAQPTCPWDAGSPAEIVLAWVVASTGNATPAQLQAAAHVIGCNISVASRRIQLALAPDGTLTVSVGVESFLRAHDVALAVPDPARLQAWLAAAGARNLTLLPLSLRALSPRYQNDPADPPTACPKGFYYTSTGLYQRVPDHATAGPGCYGFLCDTGFEAVTDTLVPICIPQYVPDWVFWTVVSLVSSLAFAVVLIVCSIRILCARTHQPAPAPPESPPAPPDNTLPVGVTATGDLVFEAVLESCSESSSSGYYSGESDSEHEIH